MPQKTSDQITDEFYNSIEDIKSFEIFGVNIIKICFLNYFIDEKSKKAQNTHKVVGGKQKKVKELNKFGRIKESILLSKLKYTKKIIFFSVAGRTLNINNIEYDIYNFHIMNYFKNSILYLEDEFRVTNKLHAPQYHKTDFTTIYNLCWEKMDICKKKYELEITNFLLQLAEKNPIFVLSIDKIRENVWQFLNQFIYYDFLIKKIKPQKVFVICHYGREAQIFAAKKIMWK